MSNHTTGPWSAEQVVELLDLAVDALRAEDEALFARFAAAPDPTWYQESNHGLLYWLFETTLAYVIFKAWIPHVRVLWEQAYPGAAQWKADLAIDGGIQGKHVFETKWWWRMDKASRDAIDADLMKLRAWKEPCCRYLMTFWWSHADEVASDLEKVRDYLADRDADVIHSRWFPSHRHPSRRGKRETMFVVCTARAR